MVSGAIDVRRADNRFCTVVDGVLSRHCFSFGRHYDPLNTAFGPLVAVNDETLQPGRGFAPHRHADVELVTWVVSGALVHEAPAGHRRVIGPGGVQRVSAGSGVVHSEWACTPTHSPRRGAEEATRYISMWLTPDEPGGAPSYADGRVAPEALAAGYVVVASGRPTDGDHATVTIGVAGAVLLGARLSQGQPVSLPEADMVHVFVVRGEIGLESGERLSEGDSARLRRPRGMRVTGRPPAEILVWLFDAPFDGSRRGQ